MRRILASKITLWVCVVYLLFAFSVTLTWYFPQLGFLLPRRLEQWMYPIDKTGLDVLRFAHFLALAALTMRFVPKGSPILESPWMRPLILSGTYSLEIFCLGVFLAFAGYYVLVESGAGILLHFLVALIGILIMTAVAWLNSWYKRSDGKTARIDGSNIANADIVGG